MCLSSGGLVQRSEEVAALQEVGVTQYWHINLTVVSRQFWQQVRLIGWPDKTVGQSLRFLGLWHVVFLVITAEERARVRGFPFVS